MICHGSEFYASTIYCVVVLWFGDYRNIFKTGFANSEKAAWVFWGENENALKILDIFKEKRTLLPESQNFIDPGLVLSKPSF